MICKKSLSLLFCLFLISCVNLQNSFNSSCLFPEEKLEHGGLINRIIKNTDIDESYKRYICYEEPNYRLVFPIPYNSKKEFSILEENISLIKKKFRESRIIIKDKKFNELSKSSLQRIKKEKEIFNNKIIKVSARKYSKAKFIYPVKGIISSEYGVKRFINGLPRNPHLGLDIAAGTGTKVVAPENGEVIYVGDFFYRGKLIIIDHGNGIISTYSHLHDIFVSVGEKVLKNKKIASVGSSGRVTGPHLHFEIIFLGTKINPILFF